MLLAIDIGNTNTVVGLYDHSRLFDFFRVTSSRSLTSDEAGFFVTGLLERMQVSRDQIDRLVIGSVVPPLTPVYKRMGERFFGCRPTIVSSDITLPIALRIDEPDQIGADRIANAVAAKFLIGTPAIVVDFGTAINFDIVDTEGDYIGGVLLPGPETSMAELARRAARLFEVGFKKTETVIGKNTRHALQSGLFYGTLGQVDYLLDKIIEEAQFKSCTVVATGGLAAGIEGHSRHITRIEPTITLEGLRLIADAQT